MIRVMNNTHIREFHGKINEQSSKVERTTGEFKVPKYFSSTLVLKGITKSWVNIAIIHNNTLEQQYLSNSRGGEKA